MAERKQLIQEIIEGCVSVLNDRLEVKVDLAGGTGAKLFGNGGALDSLALVSLIVMVEEGIETEFDAGIILASEKAMSKRQSPFLTVGSLTDYVDELVAEEGAVQ